MVKAKLTDFSEYPGLATGSHIGPNDDEYLDDSLLARRMEELRGVRPSLESYKLKWEDYVVSLRRGRR